jgi:hypothetical protein
VIRRGWRGFEKKQVSAKPVVPVLVAVVPLQLPAPGTSQPITLPTVLPLPFGTGSTGRGTVGDTAFSAVLTVSLLVPCRYPNRHYRLSHPCQGNEVVPVRYRLRKVCGDTGLGTLPFVGGTAVNTSCLISATARPVVSLG